MDSNQSGAVGGTIWGPKSPKNELNVQFFKKCPLSGCDIKTKKNSIELREKFSKLDNVLFHHI